MIEPAEKPNGKTEHPEAWDYQRIKYTQDHIERILNLKVDGHTYQNLCKEFQIPLQTLYFWRNREIRNGTELGKKLCASVKTAKAVAPAQTVKFPGGSEYSAGPEGEAVLMPEKSVPALQADEDSSLVDAVFDEVALRLGRQMIEIASLKIRLKRATAKP